MDLFLANTCLRFVRLNPNDTSIHYAEIIPDNSSSNSSMGMNAKEVNKVNIIINKSRIHRLRTITHELAHLAGLYHEHQRPDYIEFKDNLIEIPCQTDWKPFDYIEYKIDQQTRIKLNKNNIKYYFNNEFDYNSITNYNGCFYRMKNHLHFRLSSIDIKKINTLYDCPRHYSRF